MEGSSSSTTTLPYFYKSTILCQGKISKWPQIIWIVKKSLAIVCNMAQVSCQSSLPWTKISEVNGKIFETVILKNYSLSRKRCRMKSIQTQLCLFINWLKLNWIILKTYLVLLVRESFRWHCTLLPAGYLSKLPISQSNYSILIQAPNCKKCLVPLANHRGPDLSGTWL